MIFNNFFNNNNINIISNISSIYTITAAKSNTDVILIGNNDFIKEHYNDSNAFALMFKITNLNDTNGGLNFMFTSNFDLGTTSAGGTTHVYGYYGKTSTDGVITAAKITYPLTTTSTNVFTLRATEAGNLIGHPAGTTGALREGQYFVIFGLMERSNMD